MRRACVLVLATLSCALTSNEPTGTSVPREVRFYSADNPTELSQIVNGSAAQGCRMIQVVPWKEAFLAVMDCPRQQATPSACSQGGARCPKG
ncbi:MAG: hypothetical protein IAG13_10075 [Deltaproteobacteria bacterium]|nr:hypothetical protein [Nannocystaceae bacterium]